MHLAIPYGGWLAVPIELAVIALVALVTHGSRRRRSLGVALALVGLVPPFFVAPERPFLRFFVAAGSVLVVFRALDLFHARAPMSASRRVWHTMAVFDTRRVAFGPPAFAARAWARVALFALPSALATYVVLAIGREGLGSAALGSAELGATALGSAELGPAKLGSAELGAAELALRWLMGGLFAYATFEMVAQALTGLYRALGVTLPKLHDDPVLSRTVGEFWGRRWNLVVHEMLREHCFLPLARRRRVRLGAAAAFGASALLHFWITFVPLGLGWAALMALFFLLQGVALLLENWWRVSRWRRPLQHAWTVTWVLGTSPLLVEPLLRIFFP